MFDPARRCLQRLSPLAVLCFLAAANALLPSALLNWQTNSPMGALSNGFGQNLTIWTAIISCVYLLLKYPQTDEFNRLNCALLNNKLPLLLAILLLIPNATLSWLIAALAGYGWWRNTAENSAQRTAALLMMAVAIRDPLSLVGLNVFTTQLLSFDRFVTQTLLTFSFSAMGQSNIIIGEHFNLLILTGCSSFTNISLALLLWLTLTLLIHKRNQASDCWRLLSLVALSIICNSLRLSLMSKSLPDYHFYHQGLGAQLFNYLSILITLLCINWSKSHLKYSGTSDKHGVNTDNSRTASPSLPRL